ncbi:ABC transporter ATP-binding protein [Ruminiclostridium cellobioparum]|jgi:oligopeptide transport system ATP-binding protein|uniref:Oligopeptide/dipeptide ABC transporter ATP-binding protein n=1 Tax=Ruminiclostridium cellobioparum subsp. termitidis CT1112 TaxID=1195236 RepID=S0FX39_RUMCE|nr:oligopeptide/dipeptide ABC transporter ATP-binding protein [Ruminiclostridium cellobioparum]EMS73148.1 oligopeptide/dipeptide ABC transporter ATP-binding protein [Ruminiclostridium cellobioparum subsp. termitidis CT1112]
MVNSEVLLEVNNLKQYFHIRNNLGEKASVKAVDDVTFNIYRGETLGLVGESGSGKTTLGRSILRIYDLTDGRIKFSGVDITKLRKDKLLPYRKKMQYIFQDPYASLDPRMTVSDIVGEALDIHKLASSKKDREDKIRDLLKLVGLNTEHSSRYPHEFSGGQRQRIGIARAIAVEPEFIVCDEPVSALDVSIRAQIINTLEEMQERLNLTYLFISHDLGVVRHTCDRVGVMYLGHFVELVESEELYKNPLHPYTQALLTAIPEPDPEMAKKRNRIILKGEIPSPVNPPSGCKFRTRCPFAKDLCSQQIPEFKDQGNGHYVACHFTGKI